MSDADSVPVRSTTRPVSGGTATCAMAVNDQYSRNARHAARRAFIATALVMNLNYFGA
jgi:hypothetical protein